MKKTKHIIIPNEIKVHLKDLEQSIDYLVGYQDMGNHWKKEYHLREDFIEEMLRSDEMPTYIKEKVERLQQAIENIKNNYKPTQSYITQGYFLQFVKGDKRPLPVKTGGKVIYYL